MESFIDVKLREFLSKVPSLSVWLWKKSSLVFSRTRTNTAAENFPSVLKYSPV